MTHCEEIKRERDQEMALVESRWAQETADVQADESKMEHKISADTTGRITRPRETARPVGDRSMFPSMAGMNVTEPGR